MTGESLGSNQELAQISETELLARFGINAEEASQQVTFFSYTGTLSQALSDERCPVGAMIEQAHSDGGVELVRGKLGELSLMSGGTFNVVVSDKPDHAIAAAKDQTAQEIVKKN